MSKHLREYPDKLPGGQRLLYCATFPNGKIYLGITNNLKSRRRRHKAQTLTGSGFPVHRAMRRYGFDAVVFTVLVRGQSDYIESLEIAAIAAFDARNPAKGYNLAIGGGVNVMEVPAIRERMRASLTGHKDSPEVCAKKRASWTPERRAAMSRLHKGKTISADQIAKTLKKTAERMAAKPPRQPKDRRLAAFKAWETKRARQQGAQL